MKTLSLSLLLIGLFAAPGLAGSPCCQGHGCQTYHGCHLGGGYYPQYDMPWTCHQWPRNTHLWMNYGAETSCCPRCGHAQGSLYCELLCQGQCGCCATGHGCGQGCGATNQGCGCQSPIQHSHDLHHSHGHGQVPADILIDSYEATETDVVPAAPSGDELPEAPPVDGLPATEAEAGDTAAQAEVDRALEAEVDSALEAEAEVQAELDTGAFVQPEPAEVAPSALEESPRLRIRVNSAADEDPIRQPSATQRIIVRDPSESAGELEPTQRIQLNSRKGVELPLQVDPRPVAEEPSAPRSQTKLRFRGEEDKEQTVHWPPVPPLPVVRQAT